MAYLDPHLHWQCITKCKDGGVAICGRNFILPYIVLVASPGGIKFLPQIATPPSFHSFKQRGGHHKKAIAKRMYSSLHLTVVQNEVQVKQNISLAVHTSFETSVRYVSETVDEKIWHWDLLESWKNMAFLVFFGLFWCFWVSFSLSRAVSACFWHCI